MNVPDIFAPGGPLAAQLSGYEPRAGQLRMAQLVERGFLESAHTIVEAGTGIGKSLAYLIPAIRSGKRVVVSTGTIALQEQLVTKDLPLVVRALESPARVTLLKGRNNYLCKQKYQRVRADRLVPNNLAMQRLWEWADRTATGDRGELQFTPSGLEWEQLDADIDDCVGELCDHFSDCYFFQARDAARFADIIVVNHALFFLHLAGGGGILPPFDIAILDEAHQCERWATAAMTAVVSQATVGRMLRRLRRNYALDAGLEIELDEGMKRLGAVLGRVPGDRYPIEANEPARDALIELRAPLYGIENWLYAHWQDGSKFPNQSEGEAQRRRDLALRSVADHIAAIERVAAPSEDAIAWVERSDGDGRYEVCTAPFDISEFLRTTLFSLTPSVLLTSATLAASGSFQHIKTTLGLDEAQELVAPSPFDYPNQARLYVPDGRLNPKARDFAARAAPIIEETLDRSRGRAFILCTSNARMRELYGLLRERIAFPVRMQGDLPRAAMIEWFRSTKNAVLFATATFWEGIDVAGDQLSCVIIDRLPFPSPADPLVAARLRAFENQGRRSFEEYMIPAAIVRLKQGFGRLIRSAADRGVVVLLDGRAGATSFGKTIVDALPPARRISDLGELRDFFLSEALEASE